MLRITFVGVSSHAITAAIWSIGCRERKRLRLLDPWAACSLLLLFSSDRILTVTIYYDVSPPKTVLLCVSKKEKTKKTQRFDFFFSFSF